MTRPDYGTAEHWLESAHKGERLIYWIGNLAADRERLELHGDKLVTVRLDPADSVGRLMWRAYRQGRVTLNLRRAGPDMEYIATKTR